MEIELKRIGYNPRLDERAFVANLFIDGQKAAIVSNKGTGTEYYPVNEEGEKLVSDAEEILKKHPGKKILVDGKEQTVKNSLVGKIDQLFADHLFSIEKNKFDKKVALMAKQNIVIGEPAKYIRTHPMKTPIQMLISGKGRELLVETISTKVLPGMSENEKILNANIPEEVLKKAGLKDGQFLKSKPQNETKKAATQRQGIKP